MRLRISQLLLIFAVVIAAPVRAEPWHNTYLSFELPHGWTCKEEGTEFVCMPPGPANQPKPAIMILTAKIAGADDNLAAYLQHLAMNPPATGKGTIVEAAQQKDILGTTWVQATLLGSEVPDFLTRYMATKIGKIAVLYTFSAHKSYYNGFLGAMDLVVNSLVVHQPPAVK